MDETAGRRRDAELSTQPHDGAAEPGWLRSFTGLEIHSHRSVPTGIETLSQVTVSNPLTIHSRRIIVKHDA